MNIKKNAVDSIYNRLKYEQLKIKHELRDNISTFKRLKIDQITLKRRIAHFDKLLRFLKKDS